MDARLQADPQLHYRVNGASRNSGLSEDDELQFLSQDVQESLQFFENTIRSLENSLEDETPDISRMVNPPLSSSSPVEEVDGPQASSVTMPSFPDKPASPKDQDIINLVQPEPDLLQPKKPVLSPIKPDFQSMAVPPESHFEIKLRNDPTDGLPSEYNPPLPGGGYGPTDSHSSFHPRGSIPTPILIAQKIAESKAGRTSNFCPSPLLRCRSFESDKTESYRNPPVKQGPPTPTKLVRFPANISVVMGSKEHHQSLPNVSIEERWAQMLANLPGASHPLMLEDSPLVWKTRNIPTRSVSFRDPTPDKSRMEALSKLGLTRNCALSGGISFPVNSDTSPPRSTGEETSSKLPETSVSTPAERPKLPVTSMSTPAETSSKYQWDNVPTTPETSSKGLWANISTPAETSPKPLMACVSTPAETSPKLQVASVPVPAETSSKFSWTSVSTPAETSPKLQVASVPVPVPEETSSKFLVASVPVPAETSSKFPWTSVSTPAETSPKFPMASVPIPVETSSKFPVASVPVPAETSSKLPWTNVSTPAETSPKPLMASVPVPVPAETSSKLPWTSVSTPAETSPKLPMASVPVPGETSPKPLMASVPVPVPTETSSKFPWTSVSTLAETSPKLSVKNATTSSQSHFHPERGTETVSTELSGSFRVKTPQPCPSSPTAPQISYYPPPPTSPPPDVEFNSYGGKSITVNHLVSSRSENVVSPNSHDPQCLPPALANPSDFNTYGGKSKVMTPIARNDLPDILSSHIDKSQTLPSPAKLEMLPVELNSYGGKSRTIGPSASPASRSPKTPATSPAARPAHHSYHGAIAPQRPSPEHRRKTVSKPVARFRPQGITVQFSGRGATDESRRDALRKLGLLKDS